MRNKLKEMRKNKKGFTLIEVIVVLVILAIIIALAVPSVMKYIDDANDAKYEAQARAVYIAADAEIAKDYTDNNTLDSLGATPTKSLTDLVTAAIGTNEFTVENVKAYTDKNATTEATTTTKPNAILSYTMEIDGKKKVTIVRNGSVTVKDKN